MDIASETHTTSIRLKQGREEDYELDCISLGSDDSNMGPEPSLKRVRTGEPSSHHEDVEEQGKEDWISHNEASTESLSVRSTPPSPLNERPASRSNVLKGSNHALSGSYYSVDKVKKFADPREYLHNIEEIVKKRCGVLGIFDVTSFQPGNLYRRRLCSATRHLLSRGPRRGLICIMHQLVSDVLLSVMVFRHGTTAKSTLKALKANHKDGEATVGGLLVPRGYVILGWSKFQLDPGSSHLRLFNGVKADPGSFTMWPTKIEQRRFIAWAKKRQEVSSVIPQEDEDSHSVPCVAATDESDVIDQRIVPLHDQARTSQQDSDQDQILLESPIDRSIVAASTFEALDQDDAQQGSSPDDPIVLESSDLNTVEPCERCKTIGHTDSNCPYLWRTFQPRLVLHRGEQKACMVSCYNCGSNEHWGHDCPKERLHSLNEHDPFSFEEAKRYFPADCQFRSSDNGLSSASPAPHANGRLNAVLKNLHQLASQTASATSSAYWTPAHTTLRGIEKPPSIWD